MKPVQNLKLKLQAEMGGGGGVWGQKTIQTKLFENQGTMCKERRTHDPGKNDPCQNARNENANKTKGRSKPWCNGKRPNVDKPKINQNLETVATTKRNQKTGIEPMGTTQYGVTQTVHKGKPT